MTVLNTPLYAKKIIALLPGQAHPTHRHFEKSETFHILSGELVVRGALGDGIALKTGDMFDVPAGVWHAFGTSTGCVFEEISTEAKPNDSEYKDPEIQKLDPTIRKTALEE